MIRPRVLVSLALVVCALWPACGPAGAEESPPPAPPSPVEPPAPPASPAPAAPPPAPRPVPVALALSLDQDAVEENGVLKGRVTGDWGQQVLRLAWLDGAGRVVSDTELSREEREKGRGEAFEFAVEVKGGLGRLHRLVLLTAARPEKEQEAPAGWREAADARFLIMRPRTPWQDFTVLGRGEQREGDAALRRAMRGLGLTGVMIEADHSADLPVAAQWVVGVLADKENPLRQFARDPAGVLQKLQKFALERTPATFTRPAGLFDEPYLAAAERQLAERVKQRRELRPLGYSLAQGPALGCGAMPLEVDPDAEMVGLFRGWLKQRYTILDTLNRQWQTAYARWEDVLPPSTDDVKARHDRRYKEQLELILKGDRENKLPKRPMAKGAGAELPPARAFFEFKPEECRAPGDENYSAWCDYHEFLDFAFARLIAEMRTQVRVFDPGAPVGFTGGGEPGPWGGFDWWRLGRVVDWCAPEPGGRAEDLVRGLRPGLPLLASLADGGERDRFHLWQSWLRGACGALVDAPRLFTGKDLAATPAARALALDVRELASGLTVQRSLAQAQYDPIAIYYSPRSLAVHWQLDSLGDGSEWPFRHGAAARERSTGLLALEAWMVLLQDLGYRHAFVHPEQLLAGQVHVKVLVLPKVLALSDREAEALREFARLGGVVLADSQCGLFDGLGKRRGSPAGRGPAGALDEAFGVSREDWAAHEADGAYYGTSAARVSVEDIAKAERTGPSSPELRVNEPGLRATSAWRHGRTAGVTEGAGVVATAALLSRSGGLGRFLYLNLAFQDYPRLRAQAAQDFSFTGMTAAEYAQRFGTPTGGEALRILVGEMLFEALGAPLVSVRTAAGIPARGLGRTVWRDGPLTLAAISPFDFATAEPSGESAGIAQDIRVGYAEQRHWYDVRRGSYLGWGDSALLRLEPERPGLVAALPYRVRDVRGQARRTDPRGVFKIKMSLETGRDGAVNAVNPGRHVFHIEVFDPEGRRLPQYARNLTSDEGSWAGTFSLGLNEPAGKYLWLAQDVLTGARLALPLTKEGALYAELFPPVSEAQRWAPALVRHGWELQLDNQGLLCLRGRLALAPLGWGLSAPPKVVLHAPAPWQAQLRGAPSEKALPSENPLPDPYPLDVTLVAPAASSKAFEAGSFGLTVKFAGREENTLFPLRVAAVPLAAGEIQVDGKLGDPGWGGAAQAEAFVRRSDGAPPAAPTLIYLRHNDKNLYIGAKCVDGELEDLWALKVKAKGRDDPALNSGDWLEVAVWLPGLDVPPLRLRVDPAGTLWCVRGSEQALRVNPLVKTGKLENKEGWAVEWAIPWADLGLRQEPGAGRELRLGFARQRCTAEQAPEITVWRLDPHAPLGDPDGFGFGITVEK